MKRLILTICLLLIVNAGGCVSVYWFQSDKTLEECLQDSKECVYYADEIVGPEAPFPLSGSSRLRRTTYRQCMYSRGYRLFDKKKLPTEIRICEKNPLIYFFSFAGR